MGEEQSEGEHMRIIRLQSAGRRVDARGIPLGMSLHYFLKLKWQYIRNMDAPYFLGGGSFSSPEMVMLPSEAVELSGKSLIDAPYRWEDKWEAVPAQ